MYVRVLSCAVFLMGTICSASHAAQLDPCFVLLNERIGLMKEGTYSPRMSFCNSDSFCENLYWSDGSIVYFEDEPSMLGNVSCNEARDLVIGSSTSVTTTSRPSRRNVVTMSTTTTTTTTTTSTELTESTSTADVSSSTTVTPSALIPERLTSELDLYKSIPTGSMIRRLFSELMDVLRSSIIPGILRFPFSELAEERDAFEEGLLRADRLLYSLSYQVKSIPRLVKKIFAAEIAASRTLNKWRRSIGFLTANVINSYPQVVRFGSRDLAGLSIAQFLSFAKTFPVVNVAYISAAKLRELKNVLEIVMEDDVPVDDDCDDVSERTSTTFNTTTAPVPSRRPSFRITPKSLADYPHKPRKCTFCASIWKSGDTSLRFPDFFSLVAASVKTASDSAAAAPTGVGFGGSHVCKTLLSHIGDALCIIDDLFGKNGSAIKTTVSPDIVAAREFCTNSGNDTLKLIHYCNTRFRKDIARFETIPMALRLGRLCGTLLPYDTRAHVLPSLMVNSLTPLEEERFDEYETDESSDEIDEIDSASASGSPPPRIPSSHELHVPQGPDMAFVSLMRMGAMDRFSFESVENFAVRFDGSASVGDGTRKEWIASMFENMILPSFHLFEYSDEREVYMKPRSLKTPRGLLDGSPADVPYTGGMLKLALRTYRQFGRLLGMALEDGLCPGVSLTDGALAFIQRYPSKVDTNSELVSRMLKSESFYSHHFLENFRRTNWSDPEQASVVSDMDFEGLKPDGASIAVTEENIAEYIDLSARKIVFDSIETQMTSVVNGIYEVLPFGRLSFLTIDELRLLLQGQPVIDRVNLRASTEYQPANATESAEVGWLWTIIESMTEPQMRDFLRFVSGSSYPPIHNFSGYVGTRKWLQVSIFPSLTVDQVPLAQTCFVQLKLPRYTSLEVMRARLLFAIENARSMETL